MLTWPPEFTLRKSAKAKRALIRINLYGDIEVIVPKKIRFFDPHAMLNEHQSWVLKQLAKSQPRPQAGPIELPEQICFPGLRRDYEVIYRASESARLSLRHEASVIKLSGNLNEWEKIQDKLISWLNQEAGDLLYPVVTYFNELHNFSGQDLKVRFMKTRWGSCNRSGKITLNSQLVFFPLPLIHHVILHELCHTRYMSHGPRFWGLLTKLDPLAAVHNKALSQADQFLPQWLVQF